MLRSHQVEELSAVEQSSEIVGSTQLLSDCLRPEKGLSDIGRTESSDRHQSPAERNPQVELLLLARRAVRQCPHQVHSLLQLGDLSLLKIVETSEKSQFPRAVLIPSGGMVTILFALVPLLSFRFRSRASLELELVALRHQVIVLRRQASQIAPAPACPPG
jgi:hypothetical protein